MANTVLQGNAHGFRIVNRNPTRKTNVTIHSRNGHASRVSIKPRETKVISFRPTAA